MKEFLLITTQVDSLIDKIDDKRSKYAHPMMHVFFRWSVVRRACVLRSVPSPGSVPHPVSLSRWPHSFSARSERSSCAQLCVSGALAKAKGVAKSTQQPSLGADTT